MLAVMAAAALGGCVVSGPARHSDDDDDTSEAATTSGTSTGATTPGEGGMGGSAGSSTGAGGQGGEVPIPDLQCVQDGAGATLIDASQQPVSSYDDVSQCQQALNNKGEGVVCAWFTPGMLIGPGAWDETGWRAMNIDTRTGLGRRPHSSFEDCLDATKSARGGVVCTNTGVGYKAAHIGTNQWCGASSNLPYCLQATLAAQDYYVCSFPSDGDGSGPGWVLTEIAGTSCNYLTSSMPLSQCNELVP